MSKVVVTGASGKAGRAVVRALLEHDHDVLAIDVVPPADHCDQQHTEYRNALAFGFLGTDDRIPGQREGERELEEALAEELPAPIGDQVADHPGGEAERDVGRIRERGGKVVQEDVARDAAADAAHQGHQQDADDREVLVVVGASRKQRAVQGSRRRSEQIKRREIAAETPAGEPGNRVCED